MFYVEDHTALESNLGCCLFLIFQNIFLQVIAGIILPPTILLLGFRVGDDTYQGSDDKTGAKDKDDDNKPCRVTLFLPKVSQLVYV